MKRGKYYTADMQPYDVTGRVEVEGWITDNGVVGVAYPFTDEEENPIASEYALTHIPTGCRVCFTKFGLSNAQRIAERFAAVLPSTGEFGVIPTKDKMAGAQRVYSEEARDHGIY